jgi:hypothetical protein
MCSPDSNRRGGVLGYKSEALSLGSATGMEVIYFSP